MASDLYRDVLKDRDINTSNPRARSGGSLGSSDNDYKNYLAGMKPKTKNVNQTEKIHSTSFVDSAARIQTASHQPHQKPQVNKSKQESNEEAQKAKEQKSRAMYAEFSAVPQKKSIEKSFQQQDNHQKKGTKKPHNNIDFNSLKHAQSDLAGSVGRLRSMFDKGDQESKPVVQLRNQSQGKRDRPYSATFDPPDKSKAKVSGIYDRHSMYIQPLEVESLLSSSDKDSSEVTKETNLNEESTKEKDSENKIDVNSLLAPEPTKNEIPDNEDEDVDKNGTKLSEIDMQKRMEIDRMKRTQEEVLIEQKFNIKRRSLKERLSDLASGNESTPTYVSIDDSPPISKENPSTKHPKDNITKDNTTMDSQTSNLDTSIPKTNSESITANEETNNKLPINHVKTVQTQPCQSEDKTKPQLQLPLEPSNQFQSSPLKNEEDSMSEIDQYKSAVARFDAFIHDQNANNSGKDIPHIEKPEENHKILSKKPPTDVNQNVVQKLKHGDELSRSSDTDYSQSDDGDGSDLMNSILNHMERRNNGDYFSLLRSPSNEEASERQEQHKSDEVPLLVSPEAPEVLPRLSKLQGRSPTSPPPYPAEETQQIILQSQSSLDSVQSSAVQSLPESDLKDTSSCSGSSDADDSYENTYTVAKEVNLPSPPSKSNLTKQRGENKKNRVVFNENNMEEVAYTYGPKQYNRANADIDPIASSAEWELEKRVDNMDIFSVDLQKDERGLGLSIIGLGVGTETGVEKLGIFVKTLTENGASQKDGRIQVQDQILEVNGVSLVGVTQFFAAQTLKGTNGVVRFLMGRDKNRRSQFAPGAPILDNPDMKKHIEEMNKTMSQLQEYEHRALDAEHTLEEVRMELLKAEERAHEAEHSLKETKELLKVATESPFINGQRKLKNEIKKGNSSTVNNKKNEKLDDLQRSLKDVTNRLSASEENLLAITTDNDIKDKELLEFQSKLRERSEQEEKLSAESDKLKNDLEKSRMDFENLKAENNKMQEHLRKLQDERDIFQASREDAVTQEQIAQSANETKCKDLEKSNADLKAEVSKFREHLQEADNIRSQVATLEQEARRVGDIENQLQQYQQRVTEKNDEVETLKEKNNYLQTLLTKLNRSDSSNDSSTNSTNETDQHLKQENDQLKEKISALELELKASERTTPNLDGVENSYEQNHAHPQPEVPKREHVNFPVNHIIGIKPPVVLRHSKPNTPEQTTRTTPPFDITTTSSSPIEAGSAVMVAPVFPSTPESPTLSQRPDTPSEDANPVPKPPRGHFVGDFEEDFVIVEKPSPQDDTSFQLRSPEPSNADVSSLNVDSFVDVSVTSISIQSETTPTTPVDVSTEVPVDENAQNVHAFVNVENEQQKLKSDSGEDEGQFQLIQEEIEDERASLDNYIPNEDTEHAIDVDDVKINLDGVNENAFFDSQSSDKMATWSNAEWSKLDKEAELIAEQVALNSPVKRAVSNASSSSDDNKEEADDLTGKTHRAQSVKMDTYFKRSSASESFDHDHEVSVLDDEANKSDAAVISKSLSFSGIPLTPVLDTKVAQSRIQVASKNDKRKPPTKGARGSLAGEADEFQMKQSSLPRNLKHSVIDQQTPMIGSKSVPNLSGDRGVGDKLEKQHKHKFGFHLPKVFKKNKLTRKSSTDKSNPSSPTVSSSQLPVMPSVETADQQPTSESSTSPVLHTKSPQTPPPITASTAGQQSNKELMEPEKRAITPNTDMSVVPLNEKAETLNQEKANDAATEEAVVPFADKEKLMADNQSTGEAQRETSPSLPSASLHIDSPSFTTEVGASVPTTTAPTITAPNVSPDEYSLEMSTSSSRNSSSIDTEAKVTGGERASMTSTDQSASLNSDTQYNERAIDIGNGHTDEDSIDHWTGRPPSSWDVRQVGLWLVEMDLNQYVNNFKSHDVDGHALLAADGNKLKEYGVSNSEHRAEIKKKTKEFRSKLGKDSSNTKGKNKDHKRTKDKLQFWKGKYKVTH